MLTKVLAAECVTLLEIGTYAFFCQLQSNPNVHGDANAGIQLARGRLQAKTLPPPATAAIHTRLYALRARPLQMSTKRTIGESCIFRTF